VAGLLSPHYDGPFEVAERTDKVFRLRNGGCVESFSADRLKPQPEPVGPPQRGCPPGTGGQVLPTST
jgi:hypothetical protein